MAGEDRLERARQEAVRFAQEARRLARRHGRALGDDARKEVESGAEDVETAAETGKADKLSSALKELNQLWDVHLAPRQRAWRVVVEAAAVAALVALCVRAFLVDTALVRSVSMEPTILPGDVVLVKKAAYAIRLPFTHLRLLDTGAPRRGDVVVFDDPREPGSVLVKRVVGVPGDLVELREQVLHVNGVAQPRTPVGDYAVAVDGEGEGAKGASICRRYHESLARGSLAGGSAEGEARWDAAAAEGVASYDVLQCRRPRLASREGPYEVVEANHVFVLGDNRDLSADSRGLGGWQVPYGHIRGKATLVLLSWGEGGWSPHGAVGPRIERLFKALASR